MPKPGPMSKTPSDRAKARDRPALARKASLSSSSSYSFSEEDAARTRDEDEHEEDEPNRFDSYWRSVLVQGNLCGSVKSVDSFRPALDTSAATTPINPHLSA